MLTHNVYLNIIILFSSSRTAVLRRIQHVLVRPVLTTSDRFVIPNIMLHV